MANKRKALVIGEAAGAHESAVEVLQRFGFTQLDTVASLAAATAKLRAYHYDLVVAPIDTLSPVDMTVLEREVRRESSLLIGTAPTADPELILRGMRAGVQEFLVAPPRCCSALPSRSSTPSRRSPPRRPSCAPITTTW